MANETQTSENNKNDTIVLNSPLDITKEVADRIVRGDIKKLVINYDVELIRKYEVFPDDEPKDIDYNAFVHLGYEEYSNSPFVIAERKYYDHPIQEINYEIELGENVTNLDSLFARCDELTNAPYIDTKNITSMEAMFRDCNALLNVPQYDTSNVTSMREMFQGASSLYQSDEINDEYCLKIPQFDTHNVDDFRDMFNRSHVTKIPRFDISSVDRFIGFASDCPFLKNVAFKSSDYKILEEAFKSYEVDEIGGMFYNTPNLDMCTLFELNLAYENSDLSEYCIGEMFANASNDEEERLLIKSDIVKNIPLRFIIEDDKKYGILSDEAEEHIYSNFLRDNENDSREQTMRYPLWTYDHLKTDVLPYCFKYTDKNDNVYEQTFTLLQAIDRYELGRLSNPSDPEKSSLKDSVERSYKFINGIDRYDELSPQQIKYLESFNDEVDQLCEYLGAYASYPIAKISPNNIEYYFDRIDINQHMFLREKIKEDQELTQLFDCTSKLDYANIPNFEWNQNNDFFFTAPPLTRVVLPHILSIDSSQIEDYEKIKTYLEKNDYSTMHESIDNKHVYLIPTSEYKRFENAMNLYLPNRSPEYGEIESVKLEDKKFLFPDPTIHICYDMQAKYINEEDNKKHNYSIIPFGFNKAGDPSVYNHQWSPLTLYEHRNCQLVEKYNDYISEKKEPINVVVHKTVAPHVQFLNHNVDLKTTLVDPRTNKKYNPKVIDNEDYQKLNHNDPFIKEVVTNPINNPVDTMALDTYQIYTVNPHSLKIEPYESQYQLKLNQEKTGDELFEDLLNSIEKDEAISKDIESIKESIKNKDYSNDEQKVMQAPEANEHKPNTELNSSDISNNQKEVNKSDNLSMPSPPKIDIALGGFMTQEYLEKLIDERVNKRLEELKISSEQVKSDKLSNDLDNSKKKGLSL